MYHYDGKTKTAAKEETGTKSGFRVSYDHTTPCVDSANCFNKSLEFLINNQVRKKT